MKSSFRTSIIILLFPGIILVSGSCKNNSGQILITTTDISGIKQAGAVSGGNITSGKKINISARGVCWDIGTEPTILNELTIDGSGAGNYTSVLTGLKPGTSYYLRAYAITDKDTLYGNVVSFTTMDYGTVTDIEGNDYKTITIGDQTWMAGNLKTTRYRDGTPIPLVKDTAAWAALSSPGYCWYNNDKSTFKDKYGALYNGYAVNSNKLCPQGWHVPGDDEWSVLAAYAGGENFAGGSLKEAGTSHWVRPNSGATDKNKYTALPGGLRYSDGAFHDLGFSAYWWTSTQYSESRGIFRFLYYKDSCVYRFDNVKKIGFSVRCLKD
jgi:uncharacterized protein (TIGR02145 family)